MALSLNAKNPRTLQIVMSICLKFPEDPTTSFKGNSNKKCH